MMAKNSSTAARMAEMYMAPYSLPTHSDNVSATIASAASTAATANMVDEPVTAETTKIAPDNRNKPERIFCTKFPPLIKVMIDEAMATTPAKSSRYDPTVPADIGAPPAITNAAARTNRRAVPMARPPVNLLSSAPMNEVSSPPNITIITTLAISYP